MINVFASTEQIKVPTEQFLQEIQRRPCLWDPTHSLYNNSTARRHAFRSIADRVKPHASAVKKEEIGNLLSLKWKGIRDHYVNVVKSDASKLEKYNSNPYIKLLGFLDSTLSPSRGERVQTRASSLSATSSSSHGGRHPTETPPEENPPERKEGVLSQATVIIDGIEFEKVTMADGDVIIKPKEEVLDRLLPKRKLRGKKERPVKTKQPQGNQRVDEKEQQNRCQMVSESVGDGDLELKQDIRGDIQPTNTELKITSTATLASTASVSRNKQLKVIGPSTFHSRGTTHKIDENLSPNVVLTPTKAETRADGKLYTVKNQTIQMGLGSVDDIMDSVSSSQKQVFRKLSDVLKPETPMAVHRKVITSSETDCVEISDEEGESNKPAKLTPPLPAATATPRFLERWTAELKRLDALPDKPPQQRTYVIDGRQRSSGVTTTSNDSCSSEAQNSSHSLTSNKRVRTNRNTVVTKVRAVGSPAGAQTLSPNLTPTKTVKTNRNTDVLKSVCSIGSPSADTQTTLPNVTTKPVKTSLNSVVKRNSSDSDSNESTPVKRLRNNLDSSMNSPEKSEQSQMLSSGKALCTNRNKVVRTDDSCDSSSNIDEQTPAPPAKAVCTNNNTIVQEELKVTPRPLKPLEATEKAKSTPRPSTPIEILDDDEAKTSEKLAPHEEEDDDKKFLLSLLPEMKTLTEPQNFAFRLEIMQALTRARYS